MKPLKEIAEALAKATAGHNWAVQQDNGSWPQHHSLKQQINRFTNRHEPLGALKPKHCLLALAGYTNAVGTADRPGIPLKDCRDRAHFEHLANKLPLTALRLDIDCDDAFANNDLTALQHTTDRAREAFSKLGLTAYIWTTGGRGIQVVAPCAGTWHEVRRAEQEIKRLLADIPGVDKAGTEGILRLPFGLHPKTKRLGLYLDENCEIIDIDQQLQMLNVSYGLNAPVLPSICLADERKDAQAYEISVKPEAALKTQNKSIVKDSENNRKWELLRREKPQPGKTTEWLMTYGRIYAFVWAYGKDGAREHLYKIMDEVSGTESQRINRRQKIDSLFQSFVEYTGSKKSEPTKNLSAEDERTAKEYKQSLTGRKDFIKRQYLVYRAYLHAITSWGDSIDGGDVLRMCGYLYGKDAPKRTAIFEAFSRISVDTNICSPALGSKTYILDGFLVPDEHVKTGAEIPAKPTNPSTEEHSSHTTESRDMRTNHQTAPFLSAWQNPPSQQALSRECHPTVLTVLQSRPHKRSKYPCDIDTAALANAGSSSPYRVCHAST